MSSLLIQGQSAAGTGTSVVAVVLVGAVVLAFVVFFFSALSGILRSGLSGGMKLLWVVFAFCAPFLGCLCWYLIGSKDATRRRAV